MKRLIAILAILSTSFSLVSCATGSEDLHRTYCRILKSKILFAGSTSETRKSDIQESERPLYQENFNTSDCE